MAFRFQLGLVAIALLGACDQRPPEQARDACRFHAYGETLFVGDPKCMARLPQERLSGVWVRGMEHSVFYEGASHVPKNALSEELRTLDTEVWLDASEDLLKGHGFKSEGSTHAYRIDFIGTKSHAHGVYGDRGMYRRGALMQRLLKVDEIPLSQQQDR